MPKARPIHPEVMAKAHEAEQMYPDYVIALFDGAGNYCYVSVDPMPVRGYTRGDVYGRHYAEFTVPKDLPHLDLAKADTELTGQSVEVGVMVKCKNGSTAYLRVSGSKVVDPDTGEGYHLTRSRIMQDREVR